MKYECKQNDCLIEAIEGKSELLISVKGDTVKLVIGLEDLKQALNLFGVSVSLPTNVAELLKGAKTLVGHPLTNVSGSTDVACSEWQDKYEEWCNER
tara:strand:- start:45 stop:335 length:291 start_codon:yes stop_codon:yes gene_type:complete